MPPFEAPDPHHFRNVYIFAANGDHLGALYINDPPQVTNASFYRICTHFIKSPLPQEAWAIHPITPMDNFASNPLPRSSLPLQKGRYVLLGPEMQRINATITDEPALHRLYTPESFSPVSRNGSPRDPRHLRFGERVYERDKACAITGFKPPPPPDHLLGVRATHIFPLCLRQLWVRNGWGDEWIKSDEDEDEELIGPDRLYSAQNGLLLGACARSFFCTFVLTVDPDDDYRVVFLCQDTLGYNGRRLSETAIGNVSDECLRWHFHQSILTAVRGMGEGNWDDDVIYENVMDFGDYDEEDKELERESVRGVTEWAGV
ncbi:hypothetical protein BDW74DRAFT_173853 [Aspergillus multicolor]|uniref:HNH endonuclease signature motif containing protein n=1 Tax=Aspergillus multicolor TaxID=41759 RepID=UPI003CCD6CFB